MVFTIYTFSGKSWAQLAQFNPLCDKFPVKMGNIHVWVIALLIWVHFFVQTLVDKMLKNKINTDDKAKVKQ